MTQSFSHLIPQSKTAKNFRNGNTKINLFFQSNELSLNASKTKFIVFSKTKRTTNTHMAVDIVVIDEKEAIKHLGVQIDRLLTFQEATKHKLKKWLPVLRLYTIRRTIPGNKKKLILNALVLSHIHYSAAIIQSINQNLILTLDRQLNWAVKASFFRKKFDSSRDLKRKHKILPMHYYLKLKRIN